MSTLDPRTLIIVTAITLLITSAALVLGGYINRRVQGVPQVVWGYLLMTLGTVLTALDGQLSKLLTIFAANLIGLLGLYVIWMGVRRMQSRPAYDGRYLIAFILVAALLFMLMGLDSERMILRMVVFSVIAGLLCLLIAKELLVGEDRSNIADIYTGTIVTLLGISFFVRAVGAVVMPMGDTLLASKAHTSYTFIAIIALNMLVVFGYLMMMAERLEMRLRLLADTDYLTGMMCRRAFIEQVERLLTRAEIDRKSVSMILLDIDDFKSINDTYGHAAGDEVLKHFASNMKEFFRVGDVIGRIGGEEFSVVLSHVNQCQAAEIAERLRKVYEATLIRIGEHDVQAKVSIGVASSENGNGSFEQMYARADEALYEAKKCGKNCVRIAGAPLASESVA